MSDLFRSQKHLVVMYAAATGAEAKILPHQAVRVFAVAVGDHRLGQCPPDPRNALLPLLPQKLVRRFVPAVLTLLPQE